MNELFPITEPNRHHGCRVNDRITWQGMHAMILQNELIQVVLLIDKGAEIIQFLYKPSDMDFLWHSINELHNPSTFMPVGGTDATPFFDRWAGGWFEVLPNNGPGNDYKNCHLGFYGETINIPWEYKILEDKPERVSVALWVKTYRMPFLLQKILTIESNQGCLKIEEQVTNLGNEELRFAWGHHPVIGAPFLDKSCRISMPKCKVIVLNDEDGPGNRMKLFQEGEWPIIEGSNGTPVDLRVVLPKENHSMDNCYMTEFDESAFVAVTNVQRKVGFGISWNPIVFKYMWLWQAFGGGVGYPWFQNSYQMGIEPWTSFPCAGLQKSIENQTAMTILPGGNLQTWLTAVAYSNDKEVSKISKNGKVSFIS
jgi:hypothetical protein